MTEPISPMSTKWISVQLEPCQAKLKEIGGRSGGGDWGDVGGRPEGDSQEI